ncbi:hypothetical protein ACIP2X_09110 [Streptomyces sp. NPDC089424]
MSWTRTLLASGHALGHPSGVAFYDAEFGTGRAQAYRLLDVARS